MFSGCPSVCPSVRPSVLPSVRPSVPYFSLARLQENGLTDFHQNFTKVSSRVIDELIRFWAYLANFQGNGVAKYGKIWGF